MLILFFLGTRSWTFDPLIRKVTTKIISFSCKALLLVRYQSRPQPLLVFCPYLSFIASRAELNSFGVIKLLLNSHQLHFTALIHI